MKNYIGRLLSAVLIFALIFGQLSSPILVLAQETIPAPETPQPTPEPDVSPQPSPTPEPTPSATPEPTETPQPSPTPLPSDNPEATSSATPQPSPTPEPTASPSATPSATPSASITDNNESTQSATILKERKANWTRKNDKYNFKKHYIEGEALVKFKSERIDLKRPDKDTKITSFENRHSVQAEEEIKSSNIVLVESDKKTENLIAELKNDPDVEKAEPNYLRYPSVIPNDPQFGQLWGLHNIGQSVNGTIGVLDNDIDAPEAWDLETDSQQDTIVAVLDTGVAYNHPDLLANMWDGSNCKNDSGVSIPGGCPNHGWDFQHNDNDPADDAGHGTHVAGTIAAAGNNNKGTVGASLKNNIKIMALKVGDERAFGSDAIIKAINFARQNGAQVINASYGGFGYSSFEEELINSFPGLFIAAAGNNGSNNDALPHYPANYNSNNIISVAALKQDNTLAGFSNYGLSSVDVAAPGSNIISTYAYSSDAYSEDFNSVTPPNIPAGFTKVGNWATYNTLSPFSGNVLYTDANIPYLPNAQSSLTSPAINLSSEKAATIGFYTGCDTEYNPFAWTDYMSLEVSGDGSNYTEIARWDEYSIDDDFDPETSAPARWFSFSISNNQYLTGNFKYRFNWKTNGSNSGSYGDGCFIDNIAIFKYSTNQESYNLLQGTSMATPHVSGEAAMIMSYKPTLTSSQVKDTILNTGDSLPALQGKTVSGKRINLNNALRSVSQSTNADLSNLTISQGTFTPPFSPSIASYSAQVSNEVNTIKVTPTVTDSKSSVKVNGISVVSGTPSSDINLNVGNNLISIEVTAENLSTKSYTINVVRAAPDTVAPIIAIARSPNKDLNNGPYTLTVNFDDAVTKKYKVDSGSRTDYTQPVTVSSEGSHTFYAEGTDAAGNKGTAQISFEIDITAPAVTITKNPDQALSNTSYILTANFSDAVTKEYRINSGSWLNYTGEVTVDNEGNYTFEARGTDLAGNQKTAQTTFAIDKTNPIITITSPAQNARVSGINTIEFSVNEAAEVKCSLDNDNFQSCSSGDTFASIDLFDNFIDGPFTLYMQAQDQAGNIVATNRGFIKDTHVPLAPGTLTAEAGPIINSQEYSFGFSVVVPLPSDTLPNHIIKVYLGETEFISDSLTQVQISSGKYIFVVGIGTLSEDGVKIFRARIIDHLDRISPLSNALTLTLDTHAPLAPVITAIAADNKINTLEKQNVLVNGTSEANSLIKISLTDQISTKSASVKLTNNQTDYSAAADLSTLNDGNILVIAQAEDEAENISASTTKLVTKDTLSPILSAVSIASNNSNPSMAKVGDITTLSFTASEDLDNVLVSIDEIQLTTTKIGNNYSASKLITQNDLEGNLQFEINYRDLAGNEGVIVKTTTDNSTVTVDKTPPIVTGVEDNKYYNHNLTPTFNEGRAKLNGQDFSSGTEISEDGLYTLVVSDEAGNITTVTFTIDTAPPVLNLIRIPDTDLANSSYTLAIEYSDINLDSKQYQLDGGNWTDYSQVLTVIEEGNHTFEARVSDLAGNISTKQTSFRINKTVPITANDAVTIVKNTPITIDASFLLSNDKDLGGDTLSVTSYSNAQNGQVEISGSGVTFIPEDNFMGTGSFNYTVSDGLNTSSGKVYIIITPSLNDNQTPIKPVVDITKDAPQVVIVNVPFESTVNVAGGVNNATLDLSNIFAASSETTSATLGGKININSTTSLGNINLALPESLTISGPSSWNGSLNLPTLLDNSTFTATPSAGMNTATTAVVEVGFGNTKLTLNKAARIVIPGKKGQIVGYSQAGIFTLITTSCVADNQATADLLPESGECKIDSGPDLVIWTKHFTKFVTYTETAIPSAGGSSPGASNSSSSGGSSTSNGDPAVCSDTKPGSAPKLVSAKANGNNEVTLIWSKASDPVTYYLIAYGTKPGRMEYGNPNVGDKQTSQYTVKNLSGGITYYFKVRAGNNCMPGEFSNEISATAYGSKISDPAKGFSKGVLSKQTNQKGSIGQAAKNNPNVLEIIRNFLLKLFSNVN